MRLDEVPNLARLISRSQRRLAVLLSRTVSAQDVLPRPDPKFNGIIGQTYKDSTPDKIPLIKAPAGAPNVLVILIDDSGFGQWGTFGGQVPTPNLDRLAQDGSALHALSHHRALLADARGAPDRTQSPLGGHRRHHRNRHGYPGYSGQIPKSAAMVSEILRQNGYSTALFGKNHNIPDWETSISGPFDRWPGLQGFDHFYGFIGGEANQWQPALYRDHQPVEMEVPKGSESDYTLNESLADEAIKYIHQQKSVTPDRPFFIYYAPGATHAPHHVPESGSPSSRASSTRAGTSTARRRISGSSSWASFRPTPS